MFFLINKVLDIVKESIYPSSVEIQIRGIDVFPLVNMWMPRYRHQGNTLSVFCFLKTGICWDCIHLQFVYKWLYLRMLICFFMIPLQNQ